MSKNNNLLNNNLLNNNLLNNNNNNLLNNLYSIRRPTSNPAHCHQVISSVLTNLGIQYETDRYLNITVTVTVTGASASNSNSMFTAHQDTVQKDLGINALEIKDHILSVRGGGVLGGDDTNGIIILLSMILSKKPGLYVFFSQEEMGRIGSSQYKIPEGWEIKRCVSFDRKGTDNLITHQMGEKGCSNEFASFFEANFPLPFKADPTGSFTDSYSFFGTVPECVNLSCCYYNAHSKEEYTDLRALQAMVDACIEFDWESLPTVRDCSSYYEWDDSQYGYNYNYKYSDPQNSTGSISSSQAGSGFDLETLCERYPDVAATLLHSYGITEADFLDELRYL